MKPSIKSILVILSFCLLFSSCAKKPDVLTFPESSPAAFSESTPSPSPAPNVEEENDEKDFQEKEDAAAPLSPPSDDPVLPTVVPINPPDAGYNIIKERKSPDGEYTAYIFKRKSPTTQTDMYNLSVVRRGEALSGEEGNAFSTTYLFDFTWSDARTILVSLKTSTERGLVHNDHVADVTIYYGVLR